GLTAITSLLVSNHALLGLVGGVVIVFLGIRIARSRPTGPATDGERPGLAGGASFLDAAVLTLAVWAGSTLWWVVLCSVVAWLRGRVSPTALLWVNRISGAALVVFGA